MNKEIVKLYIEEYKREFPRINSKELYKWKAIKQFQDNWDIDAPNFSNMLFESLKLTNNLLASNNSYPARMVIKNAERSAEVVRSLFKNLFNEELDLTERVKKFRKEFANLNAKNFIGKNDYQGHLAVLVYLTLKYPERYYFYKYGMFLSFAKIVDNQYSPIKGRYENIIQYQCLCELVKHELIQDQELIKLHKERINTDCYYDKNLNILTQDFVYAVGTHIRKLKVVKTSIDYPLAVTELLTSSIQVENPAFDFTPKTINHAQNNIENKRIGDLGELWVMRYEREKLRKAKKPKLSIRVDHTAKNRGDGAGYDIESFKEDGTRIFIEVKTTRGNVNSTFYVTRNELERSKIENENYYLYRLYDYNDSNNTCRLMIFKGELTRLCQVPLAYNVTIKARSVS